MEGLGLIWGPKGGQRRPKGRPKGCQNDPNTGFADIEFDMVFTVQNPHYGLLGEPGGEPFACFFPDLCQERSWEAFLVTLVRICQKTVKNCQKIAKIGHKFVKNRQNSTKIRTKSPKSAPMVSKMTLKSIKSMGGQKRFWKPSYDKKCQHQL